MKTKRMVLVVTLLSIVLSTGCWNRRELADLATVMAMGIDKVPEKKEYRVSFQIVNPGAVVTGATGGGEAVSTPVTVYADTGKTLFEAIRKTSKLSPRKLFFAHVRVIVIGEPLAKEGIQDLFDLFERSHETRLTSHVVVARGGTAESIISTLTPLDKTPATSIYGKLRTSQEVWSHSIQVQIDDIIRALVSDGREPTLNGIRIKGKPQKGENTSNLNTTTPAAALQVNGIALFREGKLQRWIDGREARGVVWVINKMKSTVVNVSCQNKQDAIGIEVTGSKTTIKAQIQDAKPAFHITIRQEGNISEANCPLDLSKFESLKKLEEEWSAETKKEVTSAIRMAQREKSDIFGFGEIVNREDMKAWESMKKDWNHTFAECEVNVKVESFLRRSGMRLKPYLLQEK